jgi:glycosyltransferase involved in cell wall biosynthesis
MQKIICVSRYLAIGGICGNFEYLKSVLDALKSSKMEICYVWLDGPIFYRPWYRIPGRAVKFDKLTLGRGIKIGNRIFSSSIRVWLAGILLVAANRIGRYLPGMFPGLRRNVQTAMETVIDKAKVSGGSTSRASEREMKLVQSVIQSEKPHALLINYAYLGDLADVSRGAGVKSCILTHDVIRQFHPTARRLTDAVSNSQEEAMLLQKADALIAIQEEEAAELKRLAPNSTVLTSPSPFLTLSSKRNGSSNLMLFVGSGTASNMDGVRWFLQNVWPLIKVACPAARLRICGTVCHSLQNIPLDVELAGLVPDLVSEYEKAHLVIAPLLAGSGLKIKIAEAFSFGCPVVTTSIGLQGLLSAEGVCVLRADEPDDFANACCRLLTEKSLQGQMSLRALQYAQQHFSPEACIKPLVAWLENVDFEKSKN